jgi:myo-inositol-1(or 4)-monophosphatase
MQDIEKRIRIASRLLKEAGEKLTEPFENGRIKVFLKEEEEVVTEYDISTDKYIRENLLADFSDGWISEESDHIEGNTGFQWILDPIDGTNNFSNQIPFFCISLALTQNGKTVAGLVFDPVQKILYFSNPRESFVERQGAVHKILTPAIPIEEIPISFGLNKACASRWDHIYSRWIELEKKARTSRKYGSAALETVYVALGKLGLYFIMGYRIWDIAAALHIAQNAGCRYYLDEENEFFIVYNPGFDEGEIRDFYGSIKSICTP